jgi:hypothetical protein
LSKLTKRERSVAAKLKRYETIKNQAKGLYDKADVILGQLALLVEGAQITRARARLDELAKGHRTVRISEDGKILQLKDNTSGDESILGWGHAAVRRYELKTVNS